MSLKARYQVRMKRLKKGENGKTCYSYSTKIKAVVFAAGYQAALHDCGKTDLYVSVWDNGQTLVMDSDRLKEIASREF